MLSGNAPPSSFAPLRVVIDEVRFRELVAGKMLILPGAARHARTSVEIILSDIGWTSMLRAVLDAMAPSPDPPEAREFLPRRRGKPGK